MRQVIFNCRRTDKTRDTRLYALTANHSAQHGSSVAGEMSSLAASFYRTCRALAEDSAEQRCMMSTCSDYTAGAGN